MAENFRLTVATRGNTLFEHHISINLLYPLHTLLFRSDSKLFQVWNEKRVRTPKNNGQKRGGKNFSRRMFNQILME